MNQNTLFSLLVKCKLDQSVNHRNDRQKCAQTEQSCELGQGGFGGRQVGRKNTGLHLENKKDDKPRTV